MTAPTDPKPGTQARRILDILLKAEGGWVSKSFLVRSCGFTQASARIFELENDHGWPIEHSSFTDEWGFKSFRLVQPAAQLTLPINA